MDDQHNRASQTVDNTEGERMNYNEKLASEYGRFVDLNGEYPSAYKPIPTKKDYDSGVLKRVFAKRINGGAPIEIKTEQANRLNSNLYKIVTAKWTISGPRENRTIDGILEYGVSNSNKYEIERILKEEEVDLSKVLNNPLEYWRGH